MSVFVFNLGNAQLTGDRRARNDTRTTQLVWSYNTDYSSPGTVQKCGGTARVGAVTFADNVLCGYDWFPTPTTQRRVVALANGDILKDLMAGTFAVTLASGRSAITSAHMVAGGAEAAGNNRKLFICDGVNTVQVLSADAATTAGLSAPPADWAGANQPTFMFRYRGYMVGGGNANNRHTIYGSISSNHENFTAAGSWFLLAYPGEGEKLVAGIEAFGRGWLFKYPFGIYWIDESAGATPTGWFCKVASRDYGIAPSPHAVTMAGDGHVYFVSSIGDVIRMEETPGSISGVSFTNLTRALGQKRLVRKFFNPAGLSGTSVRWYGDKSQLWAAKGSASAASATILVHDFSASTVNTSIIGNNAVYPANPGFGSVTSLWMERGSDLIERPVGASNLMLKFDQLVSRLFYNGNAIRLNLRTTPTDCSELGVEYSGKKVFRWLHLEFMVANASSTDAQISDATQVNVITDSGIGAHKTAITNFTPTSNVGNAFDDAAMLRLSHDLGGIEGYTIELEIFCNGPYNAAISKAWVEFDLVGMPR